MIPDERQTAPETEAQRRDSIAGFFAAIYGSDTGLCHWAYGANGRFLDASYKFTRGDWHEQREFAYPNLSNEPYSRMAKAATESDVYVNPYLMRSEVRTKGNAVSYSLIHADWDGTPELLDACREKIRTIGGFATGSGTPGHLHGYLRLAQPVSEQRHRQLTEALQRYLPPGADRGKKAASDMLRPVGTFNHKGRARAAAGIDTAGRSEPVLWDIEPDGCAVDPDSLAEIFRQAGALAGPAASGADARPAAPRSATNGAGPVRVDLDALPEPVRAALAIDTGDRSDATAHVVGACLDAGLTLAQTRGAVASRADLAARLAERNDDDVLALWLKALDARQGRNQEQAEAGEFFAQYSSNGNKAGGATVFEADDDDSEPAQGTDGGPLDVQALEADFWTTRESLKHIYDTALARMASPWAVLGCTAARALATVRPNATLPPLVGGKGSLNWFAAIAAKSGGGKGSANAVARELVPGPVFMRNVGSGEGMVHAYADKESPTMTGNREAVLFNVDEVDMLTALGNRSGATIMSVLRSAFSGEALGFSYVARGGETLAEHSYRLTLVLGVQPARAGDLLADASGGTPQRFMWFPGSDSRINADTAWDIKPTPLTLPAFQTWQYPVEFEMPAEAVSFIRAENAKRARGEGDAIDGHAVFCREKLAVALALLDGRWRVTAEDWRLSGIAARVSDATRAWVAAELDAASAAEAEKLGRQRGIVAAAAKDSASQQEHKRTNRIARWTEGKLKAAGAQGIALRDLQSKAQSRDRPYLRDVLAVMATQARVTCGYAPGGGEVWKIL